MAKKKAAKKVDIKGILMVVGVLLICIVILGQHAWPMIIPRLSPNIARINGEAVPRSYFEHMLSEFSALTTERFGESFWFDEEGSSFGMQQQIKNSVFNELMTNTIVRQAAVAQGIVFDDTDRWEIHQNVEERREELGPDNIRRFNIRNNHLFRLAEEEQYFKLFERFFTENAVVSGDAFDHAFEMEWLNFQTENARTMDPMEIQLIYFETYGEAQEAVDVLDAGGDFMELLLESPHYMPGAEEPMIVTSDFPDVIIDAALALEVGQTSRVVIMHHDHEDEFLDFDHEVHEDYYIIKLVSRETADLEALRAQQLDQFTANARLEAFNDEMTRIHEEAVIDVNDVALFFTRVPGVADTMEIDPDATPEPQLDLPGGLDLGDLGIDFGDLDFGDLDISFEEHDHSHHDHDHDH